MFILIIRFTKHTTLFRYAPIVALLLGNLTNLTTTRQTHADDNQHLSSSTNQFAEKIQTAHNHAIWKLKAAIYADIQIDFGGQRVLEGAMIFDTPVGHVRMELADGTTLVFDGQEAWVSPADSPFDDARFHLLTWPYFLAAPFKIQDPGTNLINQEPMTLADHSLPTAKLSFDQGVGDSPDDWYILYRDPINRLVALAYIVTYFPTTVEQAEKEPHMITYEDFRKIDGVILPHYWQFWMWDPEKGNIGQPLGEARLSNIRFINPKPNNFEKPNNARRDPQPGK